MELLELWIFINQQPKSYSQILNQVKKLMENVEKVKRYPVSKQGGDAFKQMFASLIEVLENGFDIKTTEKGRIKELEDYFWVKVTENSEEQRLYEDNCVPLDSDKPPHKKGKCTRLMWSSTEVDEDWLENANRRRDK